MDMAVGASGVAAGTKGVVFEDPSSAPFYQCRQGLSLEHALNALLLAHLLGNVRPKCGC